MGKEDALNLSPIETALKGLTNWPGLSQFVEAFHNPVLGLIGLGVVVGTVGIICWKTLDVLLAYLTSKHQRDVELAKLGIIRAWWRFGRKSRARSR